MLAMLIVSILPFPRRRQRIWRRFLAALLPRRSVSRQNRNPTSKSKFLLHRSLPCILLIRAANAPVTEIFTSLTHTNCKT
jgi:hypothetical protein